MRIFCCAVVVFPHRVPVWYVGGMKGMEAPETFQSSKEHEEKHAWPLKKK